jgi:hypothetical protein
MPSTPQTTIQAGAQLVTLINVFTVEPADHAHLIDRWRRATEDVLCHLPGFVSANLHRSLDGTTVVNYAQWERQEAFQAMLRDPTSGPLLRERAEIATPAPVRCEVVSVHHV